MNIGLHFEVINTVQICFNYETWDEEADFGAENCGFHELNKFS